MSYRVTVKGSTGIAVKDQSSKSSKYINISIIYIYIPGSSRYVRWYVFGVKRHKLYTLGRSRYSTYDPARDPVYTYDTEMYAYNLQPLVASLCVAMYQCMSGATSQVM